MSKRLTDTEKWSDPWFIDLSSWAKILFGFLCDNCDIAGFYERHDKMTSFCTGIEIMGLPDIYKELEKSVVVRERWVFVKNFIRHQKNFPFNPANNCHRSIIRRLECKNDLFSDVFKEVGLWIRSSSPAPVQPLPRGIGKGKGKGKGKEGGVGETSDPEKPTAEDLIKLWNKEAHPNLPRVQILTDTRKKHANARLEAHPEQGFWNDLIQKINRSPLLKGENGNWKANFDWVLNPSNLAKILEGNYEPSNRR